LRLFGFPFFLFISLQIAYSDSREPINITVDLTDAPRKLLHAHMQFPVHAGTMTLYYPQWIPGEHGPTGPIENLAGLAFTAAGKTISWKRDDVHMYALQVTIPEGVTTLEARLDYLATADTTGFSAGACTTPHLAILNWNLVTLYPAGTAVKEITFRPSVKLPEGWHFGTALSQSVAEGTTVHFQPVTLETLIDSPVLAGQHFREVALAPDVQPKHYLDIAADEPEDLAITTAQISGFSTLVRQTGVLFRSRHYNSYHFLLTLSDSVAHFGLEHHQSSDDRVEARTLIDEDFSMVNADLLPHEFVHSWNGKYRRPAGLATSNYQQPMKGELLWVYEGLTQYLGDVLAARSGLWSGQQFREYLAQSAAEQDHRPGRTWRSLEDTATSAQILYADSESWDNWRRSTDFYPEGELLWLDVDTLLRKLSDGRKSLNDFCGLFYGPRGNSGPEVAPYTFEDVVKALGAVQAYDWAGFLRGHLEAHGPHAPLSGIEQGGYKLEYTEEMNDYIRASEGRSGVNAWYSVGLTMSSDATIRDVLMDSPAYRAGLGPGMKIVAVNGLRATEATLRAAIGEAKTSKEPLQLIVQNDDTFRVLSIDCHAGQRYPHLVRAAGEPDRLDEILKPIVITAAPTKQTAIATHADRGREAVFTTSGPQTNAATAINTMANTIAAF
jgi:predicted metalloprotease with PDZ domain